MNNKRAWIISDTHGYHGHLVLPKNCDTVIHCGDFANNKDIEVNTEETISFMEWFSDLPMPNKIVIPGNHDISISKSQKRFKSLFLDMGINLLIDDELVIDDVKFYGSPWTPTFGDGWCFNCSRSKIHKKWNLIPDDIDVLITHGPPKGRLDLTDTLDNKLICVGCSALQKRVEVIKPRFHLFGHIHNKKNKIWNFGELKDPYNGVTYINASAVYDGGMVRTDILHNGHEVLI